MTGSIALTLSPTTNSAPESITPQTKWGNSRAIRDVLNQARQYSKCDIPVLITGEAGTGKRLIARTIHKWSSPAPRHFLAVHCGAASDIAIQMELFGCEKDAFRGSERRRGVLERASGGAVFLEEVGNLPESCQGPLLRVIDAGELVRLGGRETIKTDLRVISSAMLSDADAVAGPRLRPDLYYRLSVLRLHLPPLRNRKEDIEPLARQFLQDIAARLDRAIAGFSPGAMDALRDHRWPGNARELTGVIQRAAVLCTGHQIEETDLHFEEAETNTPSPASAPHPRPAPNSAEELNLLIETLKRTRFNITKASKELGVSRVTFYRMLQRNGVEVRQDFFVGRAADHQ